MNVPVSQTVMVSSIRFAWADGGEVSEVVNLPSPLSEWEWTTYGRSIKTRVDYPMEREEIQWESR